MATKFVSFFGRDMIPIIRMDSARIARAIKNQSAAFSYFKSEMAWWFRTKYPAMHIFHRAQYLVLDFWISFDEPQSIAKIYSVFSVKRSSMQSAPRDKM